MASIQNNMPGLEPYVTNYSEYAQLSDVIGPSDDNHTYSTLEQSPLHGLRDSSLPQEGHQHKRTAGLSMTSTQNNPRGLEPTVTNYSHYAQLSDNVGPSDENHTYSTLKHSPLQGLRDSSLPQEGHQHERTAGLSMTSTQNNPLCLEPSVTNYLHYENLPDKVGYSDEMNTYSTLEQSPPLELGDLTLSCHVASDGEHGNATEPVLGTESRQMRKLRKKKICIMVISIVVLIVVIVAVVNAVIFLKGIDKFEYTTTLSTSTESWTAAPIISTTDRTEPVKQESTQSQGSFPVKINETTVSFTDNFESATSTPNDLTNNRGETTYTPPKQSIISSSTKIPETTLSIADTHCSNNGFTAAEVPGVGPAPLFWYSSLLFSSHTFRRCYIKVVTTRNETLVINSRSEIGTYSDSTVSVGDLTGTRTECTDQRVACMEIRTPGRVYTDWTLTVEAEDSTRVYIFPDDDSLQYLNSVIVNFNAALPEVSDIQVNQNTLEVSFLIDSEFDDGTSSKVYCDSDFDKEKAAIYARNKCLRGSNFAYLDDGHIVTDNLGIKYS